MAHVCYSLYFTDFVGESVFGGDPAVSITLLNTSYLRYIDKLYNAKSSIFLLIFFLVLELVLISF